jgi:ComF family protein
MVSAVLLDAAESVFSTLFPADCRLCGLPLLNASRLPVCTDCLAKIEPFKDARCHICGEILFSAHLPEAAVCGECQRARPRFERAFAHGAYDGSLRDLIQLLKYHRIRTAAVPLGEVVAGALLASHEELQQADVLVPVPLRISKSHLRGFNQAEEIARVTQKILRKRGWELPIQNLLVRVRPTTSQTGLSRSQRRANVRGAFQIVSSGIASGRNIILIDDVLTTGTTAQECARILRRGGASRVWVATAARVSKQPASISITMNQEGKSPAAYGTAAGE